MRADFFFHPIFRIVVSMKTDRFILQINFVELSFGKKTSLYTVLAFSATICDEKKKLPEVK